MNRRVIKDLRAMEGMEAMTPEAARTLARAKGFIPKALADESIPEQPETPTATEGAAVVPTKVDELPTAERSMPTTEEVSPMAENSPETVPGTVEEDSTVAKNSEQPKAAPAAQDDARFKALEDQLAKQSELLEQQSKALEASNAKAEANAKAARHLQVRAEVTERFNAAKSLAHGLMSDSGKLTPAAYKHLFGEDNDAAKASLNGHISKATGEEIEGPTLDQIDFYLDMVSQFGETKAAFVPTSKPSVEKPDYSGVDSADDAQEKAFDRQFANYAIRMGDNELIKSALVNAKADNATDLIEKLEAALND